MYFRTVDGVSPPFKITNGNKQRVSADQNWLGASRRGMAVFLRTSLPDKGKSDKFQAKDAKSVVGLRYLSYIKLINGKFSIYNLIYYINAS